ncbi:MAG TPA: recombinase family protein [Pyrinomonadaceae bacterium]|nr:recombinase family protein [Pyrinomonadaceae bacterium]
MIGAYIRVSSADQKHDSQRAEIQKYMKNNGISAEQVTWYEDTETGTKLQRPEFDRLQRDIFAGKVKTVIIWKLDRLSRNLRDGVNVLADWAEKGLKIVVVTQQLELNGVIGRTIAALLLGLAEIERGNIRERQKAGIEAAKARGVYTGRAIGSTKAKPGRARELQKKGLTVGEIAKALGVSSRTVTRYLTVH